MFTDTVTYVWDFTGNGYIAYVSVKPQRDGAPCRDRAIHHCVILPGSVCDPGPNIDKLLRTKQRGILVSLVNILPVFPVPRPGVFPSSVTRQVSPNPPPGR